MKADNGLGAIVRGYLIRALRKIDDITTTDAEPDFKIKCIAAQCSHEDSPECYALSFAVSSNTDFLFLLSGYGAEGKPFPEEIYKYLGEKYELAQHLQVTTPRASWNMPLLNLSLRLRVITFKRAT